MARNGPTSPAGTRPWLPVPFSLWPAEARLLLGMVALWCLLGLAVLGSASWWVAAREMGDATYYLKRQALWLIASWGLLYLGLRINLRRWLRLAAPALLIGMVLIALTLVIGSTVNGASRW
ncbi:MAG: FtsW/RodA/SpoVE family cell cycle protein, partial [Vulcanococcus sp.]